MDNRDDLQGLSILITRPKAQAIELMTLLQQANAKVFLFSSVEIINSPILIDQLKQISDIDYFIFTSKNAVIAFFTQTKIAIDAKSIFAMGPATAAALEKFGCRDVRIPHTNFSTEGLLTLPEFQANAGKRIAIIKGEGGRELLASTLRQRNFLITEIAVYRRQIPAPIPINTLAAWQADHVKLIIALSNESLQNLYHLTEHSAQDWLLNCQLVVASQRQVELAKQLGFTYLPLVPAKISSLAILETVKSWYAKEKPQ